MFFWIYPFIIFTDIFYGIYEKGIVPNWCQGIYDQLIKSIRNRLCVIFHSVNKSTKYWTYQLYYYAFSNMKMAKFKIDAFLWEIFTMAHWIRLSLLCRCKWTRKSQVLGKDVSEQYLFFMSIKVYIVFIQEIWVQIYGYFWVQSLCLLGACLWLGWVHQDPSRKVREGPRRL